MNSSDDAAIVLTSFTRRQPKSLAEDPGSESDDGSTPRWRLQFHAHFRPDSALGRAVSGSTLSATYFDGVAFFRFTTTTPPSVVHGGINFIKRH